MLTNKKLTPEGVQDFLPKECYNKSLIEKKMAEYFHLSGYEKVDTPMFEYLDVINSRVGSIKVEQMIKFIDHTGKILALRPDMTIPIARMSSTRMKNEKEPQRLYYQGNVFRAKGESQMMQRECTQSGVELLGVKGPQGDAEVIALAIETLKRSGLEGFTIDIGQVEFFKGLMEEAGLNSRQIEELREYVDQKSMLSIELFIKENGLSSNLEEIIMQLPTLYGKQEVLENAKKITCNQRALNALSTLNEVYEYLKAFGLSEYISFDLGMLYSLDYYTGLIFRGITDYLGSPMLSGGRYDTLTQEFGCQREATGFAIEINSVLKAIERQGNILQMQGIDVLVSSNDEMRAQAYEYASSEKEKGTRVVVEWAMTKDEIEACAKDIGAKAIYFE